jgi:basic membrane protein A
MEIFKLAISAKWISGLLTLTLGLSLAACNLSANDCARPDVFCVGLVTAYGKVDDHGLNQLAWEGVQQAQAEGLVAQSAFIETVDARDRAKNIATFADAGYDIIVSVGFAMSEPTRLAADEWPGAAFIGVDQPQEESRPNLAGLVFPEDQGGFLAGALAAQVTRTKKIAAACEVETIPEMWRYCEGFSAGVRYITADIRPRVVYHPDHSPDSWFNDAAWGGEQVQSFARNGVDVMFAAGGETARGALQSAAGRGIYVIGADEDMYYQVEAADFVLGSAVKQADAGVYELVRLAVSGQFPAGDFMGAFALSPARNLERLIQPGVRERLEALRRGLADGSIQTGVPALP